MWHKLLIIIPLDSLIGASSQQDLTTSEILARFASQRSPAKNEDTVDVGVRGKELATRCWEEDEDFLAKDKIAEWLGGQSVATCLSGNVLDADSSSGARSTRRRSDTIWTSSTSLD